MESLSLLFLFVKSFWNQRQGDFVLS
jgi:hypothetical protein